MSLIRNIVILSLIICYATTAGGQIIGFRFALNSGVVVGEIGQPDQLHSISLTKTPATASERFSPHFAPGFESEIIIQATPKARTGVELEYSSLRGINNNPPYFNYFLTSYFDGFQGNDFKISPLEYKTTLLNVAVNWKQFLYAKATTNPFVKLTGVVSFVGTELRYQNAANAPDPNDIVLYGRGSSHTDQKRLPVFHLGAGIGVDHALNKRWSLQADATATVVNSSLLNGVPNFTSREGDILKYNNKATLTFQLSAGLVYKIKAPERGFTEPGLPFYRKKR